MRQKRRTPLVSGDEDATTTSQPLPSAGRGEPKEKLEGEASGEAAGEKSVELEERDGIIDRATKSAGSRWPDAPPPRIMTLSSFLVEGGDDSVSGRVIRRIARSPQAAAIRRFLRSSTSGSDPSSSPSFPPLLTPEGGSSVGKTEAGGNEIL
jgi:hypothetical protein